MGRIKRQPHPGQLRGYLRRHVPDGVDARLPWKAASDAYDFLLLAIPRLRDNSSSGFLLAEQRCSRPPLRMSLPRGRQPSRSPLVLGRDHEPALVEPELGRGLLAPQVEHFGVDHSLAHGP